MSTIGSSVVSELSSENSSVGPTGPTGPTGPIGPIGSGATGATGNSVIGISLVDRYIITTFFDGTTYGTSTQAIGKTGDGLVKLDFSNIGTGNSLGYSITNNKTLAIRPIVFLENENSKYNINLNSENNAYDINLITNSSGITLLAGSSSNKLLTFNSTGKPQTLNNTSINEYGVNFVSANIFEFVRGGGWTGSTGAINCFGSVSGITCILNPCVPEYGKMYGSKSHVYYTNFRGMTASIGIINPPNDKRVYGFDLFVRNALNPTNISDRFGDNIKWSLNRAPCFSFAGTTCDLKLSFFGLGGSTCWYGSAVAIPNLNNKTCPGLSLFDSNCEGSSSFVEAGSAVPKNINDIGACCSVDGLCVETYASECSGFFHGAGTTCGNINNSICNKIGACCVYMPSYSCYDYLTCTECLALGYDSSISTFFGGNFSNCKNVNCLEISNNYFNFL